MLKVFCSSEPRIEFIDHYTDNHANHKKISHSSIEYSHSKIVYYVRCKNSAAFYGAKSTFVKQRCESKPYWWKK